MLMKWHDQSAVQQYNQPDLGSDRSSLHGISVAQSFLRRHFADLRKQCWRHSMSAVFSGYKVLSALFTIFVSDLLCKGGIEILMFVLQSCFLTVYIFV